MNERSPSNIRISAKAYSALRALAEEEQSTMQAVLDRAIEHYRREQFLRGAAEDYAALRRRPKEWREYVRELADWEAMPDGLERE